MLKKMSSILIIQCTYTIASLFDVKSNINLTITHMKNQSFLQVLIKLMANWMHSSKEDQKPARLLQGLKP